LSASLDGNGAVGQEQIGNPHVHRVYDRVGDASFDIIAGETFVIMGLSGPASRRCCAF